MDNFISAVTQLKASEDTKYDVLYVNTPWNKLSVEQMGKIDLSALTKDEALMYMWADTYSIQASIALFRLQGFKFESVYQICDVATYAAPEPKAKPIAEMMGEQGDVSSPPLETPETPETADASGTPVDKAAAKPTVKRVKKLRCPPLALPKYWKDVTTNPRVPPPSSSCSGARATGTFSTSS